MAQSKLTLLMELKNKLFNEKLMATKRKFEKVRGGMSDGLRKLKASHLDAFSAMRAEIPLLGRAMDMLGNPYVLATAGAVALGSVMVKGFNEAKKFDHAFLQIKNLNLDKPKGQMDKYRESIRDAAFESGTSLTDTTKAFYDLQSATGLFGSDAEKVFKNVAKYSIATGANLNDAMNSTTKAMKAFGMEVKDIDAFLASNAKTVQTGITTFDELARVQTEFAGAASGAGQSVDTANKIFAAFTSVAKDSNIAANMTKTAFQGLTQAGTIKGLKSIGISLYDAKGNMRDLGDVLKDISGQFKNMSPQQIDALINKIGGPEGLRSLFVKLKTGADDFHSTLENFDNSKFDLEKALKNAQGDFTVLSGIVRNRFNTIMASLGEKIMPAVLRVFNGINNALDWANRNWDTISTVLEMVVPVVGTLVTVLIAAKIAMWAFNVAVMANPIGLIIAAIAAVIALVVMVIRKWKEWGAALALFMGPIGLIINAFMTFKKHWNAIVEAFKTEGIIGGLKRIGLVLLDVLLYPVQQLLELLSNIPGLGSLAGRGAKFIEDIRANLNLVDPKEKEKKVEEAEKKEEKLSRDAMHRVSTNNPKGILPGSPLGSSRPSADLGSVAGAQLDKAGSAQGPKSITFNIEAFNKGGINTANTTLAKMDSSEIENWFRETLMRAIRAAEMS